MDRTERFYRIQQLLEARRVVPREVFLEELDVSLATFKRDLEYLRDRLHAPIVWDRQRRGYRFDQPAGGPEYALPGMWFNASEIHALLTMNRLLEGVQPGLLGPYIKPLQTRIAALLDEGEHDFDEVERRIRVIHLGARQVDPRYFGLVSRAVLSRRRLSFAYYNRARDDVTERTVSPQRLTHYRENWYLDAWCHQRQALRCFALESIRDARLLDEAALDVDEKRLEAELESGYGIFGGRRTQHARLRFSPTRARWVAGEQWHPKQQGRFDEQGRYIVEFPYADDRELVMDILRHGAEVEVLAPDSLRRAVMATLSSALEAYRGREQ